MPIPTASIARHPGLPGDPLRERFLSHCPCLACDQERAREQTARLAAVREPSATPTTRRTTMPKLALIAALLLSASTASAEGETPHRFPGNPAYPHRLAVDEGPTFRVRYHPFGVPGTGDPRRVSLEDGRRGILNCRQHTFRITGGPSYVVDC